MSRVCSILVGIGIFLLAPQSWSTIAQTDPALRAFRSGGYAELEERLDRLMADRRGELGEHRLYWEFMGRTKKAIELDPALNQRVEDWIEAIPDSANARVLQSAIEQARGWKVRGGGFANTVPKDAWPVFHAHFGRAAALLEEAWSLDSRHLPLAVERINVAIFSGAGIEAVVARFEDALAIDPTSVSAHRVMRMAFEARWYGSDVIAMTFLREAARMHPDAPGLAGVLADFHFRLSRRGPRGSRDGFGDFSRPEIWDEVHAALTRYSDAFPDDVWAHNRLAWLAWRGGRRDLARRELEILNGEFLDEAWDAEMTPERAMAWANSTEP